MTPSRLDLPRLSLPVALLVCLGLIVLMAGVLAAMGQPLICKCGYVKLWHGGRTGSEMSQHLADWYTYSHVLHGIIFYAILTLLAQGRLSVASRLLLATMIEVGWEIFENSSFIIDRYRTQTVSRDYYGDSIVNSVADVLAMMVGVLIAARLPAWVTVFLLIATEVTLLVLLRDNLFLNVLMLVYPLDWIRQWQAGG